MGPFKAKISVVTSGAYTEVSANTKDNEISQWVSSTFPHHIGSIQASKTNEKNHFGHKLQLLPTSLSYHV